MFKKRYANLIIILVSAISLYLLIPLTGILKVYKVPSNSNFPTIKPGDRIYVSRLFSPKRFSFIAYRTHTEQFGNAIYTQRLCGLEGDTIEMRAGDLYINGQFADSSLSLAHFYTVPLSELSKIERLISDEEKQAIGNRDSVTANLADADVRRLLLKATRQVMDSTLKVEELTAVFKKSINADYFGPVVVPKNKYFLLGDNRSASQDSRYLGFADKSDFVGTVIQKW
jgi:signal peptidase I